MLLEQYLYTVHIFLLFTCRKLPRKTSLVIVNMHFFTDSPHIYIYVYFVLYILMYNQSKKIIVSWKWFCRLILCNMKRICWNGGVTGRLDMMCPCTNVKRPLVPKVIVPCDTMSLDWYIPVIFHCAIRLGWRKMTGMYSINAGTFCFRDDESWGPGVPENSYVDT